MYQPPKSGGCFLRVQDSIAENFIIPHGILVLAAGIAGVALDGVDDAVLAFFHNADVIGFAVLLDRMRRSGHSSRRKRSCRERD